MYNIVHHFLPVCGIDVGSTPSNKVNSWIFIGGTLLYWLVFTYVNSKHCNYALSKQVWMCIVALDVMAMTVMYRSQDTSTKDVSLPKKNVKGMTGEPEKPSKTVPSTEVSEAPSTQPVDNTPAESPESEPPAAAEEKSGPTEAMESESVSETSEVADGEEEQSPVAPIESFFTDQPQ